MQMVRHDHRCEDGDAGVVPLVVVPCLANTFTEGREDHMWSIGTAVGRFSISHECPQQGATSLGGHRHEIDAAGGVVMADAAAEHRWFGGAGVGFVLEEGFVVHESFLF